MDISVQGLCKYNVYSSYYESINEGCQRNPCKFAHVDKHLKYIDSHCHLDLLHRLYNFHIDSVKMPDTFGGCIANFCSQVNTSCCQL